MWISIGSLLLVVGCPALDLLSPPPEEPVSESAVSPDDSDDPTDDDDVSDGTSGEGPQGPGDDPGIESCFINITSGCPMCFAIGDMFTITAQGNPVGGTYVWTVTQPGGQISPTSGTGPNFTITGVAKSQSTNDVQIKVTYTSQTGLMCSRTCLLTVLELHASLDLDIDSDNSNNTPDFGPQRTNDEEMIEDDAMKPGKFVYVNGDDDDNDEITDYGDGYNLPGNPDGDNPDENDFVKVVLEVPTPTNPDVAKVKVTYPASDPAAATISGTPPVVTLPSVGRVRLWTKNGNVVRNSAAINAMPPGDFIPTATTYKLSDFGITTTTRVVDLYVEAVKRSVSSGSTRILFEMDPDGDIGPAGFECIDAVRLSAVAVDLDVDSDNTVTAPDYGPNRNETEDAIEDDAMKSGRIVLANYDDDDQDSLVDFADGYNLAGVPEDDVNASEDDFVKMVLELPEPIDLNVARVRVVYDASDPAGTTTLGAPPYFKAADGAIRIWRKNGNLARNKNAVDAVSPGDFVRNNDMTDGYFTGQLGFSGGSRTANLWIEGIKNTGAMNQQIKVSVDPDGAAGPAGFVLSDAVRVFVPLIEIRDSTSMLTDHVEIGHWGADAGSGLTGYDTMTPPMVINTSSPGGTFIDSDPDRFTVRVSAFYENTNPAIVEDFQVSIGTEGSAADDDDPITLLETGANTGIFESEFMLMMSPDVPTADNPDDNYDVYTQRTMPPARIIDDMPEDRTHRADVDGRLRVTYDAPGGSQKHSVPVCARYPTDQRKVLNIQVYVFNEPFMDANTNMAYDSGESFIDISTGATAFATTGTWGPIWTDTQVNRELDFLRAYTSSACIRVTEVGPGFVLILRATSFGSRERRAHSDISTTLPTMSQARHRRVMKRLFKPTIEVRSI